MESSKIAFTQELGFDLFWSYHDLVKNNNIPHCVLKEL